LQTGLKKKVFMKKTGKRIAMVLVLVMLSNTVTGCLALAHVAGEVIVAGAEAMHDAVEDARYRRVAETVSQYDEVDSF
jgi:predicted DNA repair protein MutK